ncbi:MAG: hypothetical protein IT260_18370 [Saprospiraceae bacterium]|nr:hypothetical protein [Saprospiraceae bacterium]
MNTSVFVFQTDIHSSREAVVVCHYMQALDGVLRCTIDLDDCDKVLKVEGSPYCKTTIEQSVSALGFFIRELPD